MLLKMQKFLSTHYCRRKLLLEHFKKEDDPSSPNKQRNKKNCCDNCRKYAESGLTLSTTDYTQEAYNCIAALKLLMNSAKNGLISVSLLVSFLMGSRNQSVTSKLKPELLKSEFYCSGATGKKNDKWWKEFIQQLMIMDHLKTRSISLAHGRASYNVLELTEEGEQFLADKDRSFKIIETTEMKAQNSGTTMKGKGDVKSLPKLVNFQSNLFVVILKEIISSLIHLSLCQSIVPLIAVNTIKISSSDNTASATQAENSNTVNISKFQ